MDDELLSLPECQARLRASVGPHAPTLITLKRWSASGKLDAAKVQSGRARPRYRYGDVEEVARKHAARSTSARARDHRVKAAARAGVAGQGENAVLIVDRGDLDALKSAVGEQLAKLGGGLMEEVKAGIADKILGEVVAQAMTAAMSRLTKDIVETVASVEVIRRTLMLKYDSETAMLRARNEELKAENDRLKRAAVDLDAQRISAQLNKIIDRLGVIHNPPA